MAARTAAFTEATKAATPVGTATTTTDTNPGISTGTSLHDTTHTATRDTKKRAVALKPKGTGIITIRSGSLSESDMACISTTTHIEDTLAASGITTDTPDNASTHITNTSRGTHAGTARSPAYWSGAHSRVAPSFSYAIPSG